jgi:hypothetical protein
MRGIPFIVFVVFIALLGAYVAGRVVLDMDLDIEWAAAASALVFAITILVMDRHSSK